MMKKILKYTISVTLIVIMLFSLSACGQEEYSEENNVDISVTADILLLFRASGYEAQLFPEGIDNCIGVAEGYIDDSHYIYVNIFDSTKSTVKIYEEEKTIISEDTRDVVSGDESYIIEADESTDSYKKFAMKYVDLETTEVFYGSILQKNNVLISYHCPYDKRDEIENIVLKILELI